MCEMGRAIKMTAIYTSPKGKPVTEWRPVPVEGYCDHYSVSNLGQLRRESSGRATRVGRFLKPALLHKGYLGVSLHGPGLGPKTFPIHRLVAVAFLGVPPAGKNTVNHKDGIKANNAAGNLEWVTQRENMQHAYRNNLIPALRGEKHGRAKLTARDVVNIRRRYGSGKVIQRHLASEFGVSQQTISRIILCRGWKTE